MLWCSSNSCISSCQQETKTKTGIYPVTLCEVKRHLRIDNEFVDDDAYLESLIIAATTMAENYTEKNIAETSTVLRIDDFNSDWIKIFEGNFLSVTSVKNASDVSIGTIHQTSKHDDFFTIEWTSYLESDPIYITYKSGFEEDQCPALLKQAILIKIADLYDDQRADMSWGGLKDTKVFESILNWYKMIRF